MAVTQVPILKRLSWNSSSWKNFERREGEELLYISEELGQRDSILSLHAMTRI